MFRHFLRGRCQHRFHHDKRNAAPAPFPVERALKVRVSFLRGFLHQSDFFRSQAVEPKDARVDFRLPRCTILPARGQTLLHQASIALCSARFAVSAELTRWVDMFR